ncbi:MAG: tetratricopeptide repeat protein [Xenococcaceae cyanobacterium MO_188.B19]|nr:tetratricopeptide repeat protein [Xenococcaceae cyanobacterium MO_188.B19]
MLTQEDKMVSLEKLHSEGAEKYRKGDFKGALSCYQEAINLEIKQPEWIYSSAIILLAELGNFEEAAQLGDRALQLYPNVDEIYRAIGVALDKQGDIAGAINNYQEATRLNSRQPEWVYSNLTNRLIQVSRLEQAINLAQQGIELYPEFYWLHYHLGEAFGFEENWNKAIAYYQQALKINPELYQASQKLQEITAKRKHLEEMEKTYQEALSTIPIGKSTPQKLYVLDAYQDDPTGLGVVARRCFQLGELVADSRCINGKILVAARPDIYRELVRPENINYIWTTFESSQIPESWVKSINENFTEVFVPHPYLQKVFQISGVNRPITVLPQSYPERHRIKPIDKQLDRLRLGILGVPNRRKNFDKVVEAVVELRKEGHNVELMIHCPWLLNDAQKAWEDLPGISLTVEKLSDDEINQWYSKLDAYIYPSSGEGWSFTPREAMSLGIPTIITDIPVHQELVESGCYLSINSNRWEPAYYEFLDGNCGEWKTYSASQIKDAIIEMIDNYDHWYKLAQTGQNWIKEQSSTWEQSEKKLLEKIFPTAKNISEWILEYANSKKQNSNKKMSQDKQYELYLALSGVME